MISIHDDLIAAIDSVEILSPSRYMLLGELRDAASQDAANRPPVSGPVRLTEMLARDLYDGLYLRPSLPPLTRSDELSRRDLLAAICSANVGQGHWESGWSVRRIAENGRVVVAREDLAFWALPADVRVDDGTIQPGAHCRVRVPKEVRGLPEGFYVALGDEDDDTDSGGDSKVGEADVLVRYYWHLTVGMAVPFLAAATSLLNASGTPFRLKMLRDPDAYHRADAGVIYLRWGHQSRAEPVISQIYTSVAPGLRPAVPLFTRRLADGLGFAEDPANSMSFGEHRCRLVAEALFESFSRGEADRDARAATLASAFRREGLDPLRPYLGRGSRDERVGASFVDPAVVNSTDTARPIRGIGIAGATDGAGMSFLEVASRIGRALCRTAHWDRGGRLCNWMGRSTADLAELGGPIMPVAAAVEADLYGGSAGIALFLAQLHALTGVDEFRRAALAGITRSLDRFDRVPPRQPLSPLSFFSGDLGVAFATHRVAALIGLRELLARAGVVLERVIGSATSPHMLDVIGGNAGAIPALLEMGDEPGWGRCRDLAIVLGEEICRTGAVRARHDAASSDSSLDPFASAGLAHGAAGIGLALFELHAATDRTDFRDAARRLFEREDTLFDAREGNWASVRDSSAPPQFLHAWCNGAPGIVLSRMRAAVLDPDLGEEHLDKARVGITTTLDAIERRLASPRCDASPCHGLMGLIEIAVIAGQMLDHPSHCGPALAAASALIERHATAGDWPSGLYSGGPNPSLMIGTAGIGYTFLRLHDPERVPCVLWIGC